MKTCGGPMMIESALNALNFGALTASVMLKNCIGVI